MVRAKRFQQRYQTAVAAVGLVAILGLVLLFAVGMLLAWLDLLPPPYCGTVVHWWSWCRYG
jgi:hypothetical protein